MQNKIVHLLPKQLNMIKQLTELELYKALTLVSPLIMASLVGFDRFKDPVYREDWEQDFFLDLKRRLFLEPRDTFKTTLFCIYFSQRLIIDPNIRLIIIGLTKDEAKLRLNTIRFILNHPSVVALHGKLVDEKKSGAEHLNLITRTNWNKMGHNISIHSVISALTGNKADILWYDDPCDYHDTFEDEIRKKKIQIFEQNIGALDETEYGEIVILGTKKHKEDLFGNIVSKNEELEGKYKWNIRKGTPYNKDGSLRFPTYLDKAKLDAKIALMGRSTAAHELFNEPMAAGDRIFLIEDFKFYNYNLIYNSILDSRRRDFKLYAFLDLAISEKDKADNTAFSLIALEQRDINGKNVDNIYLLEGIPLKGNPTYIYNQVLEYYDKWYNIKDNKGIDLIGIESNAFQKVWIDGFKTFCEGKLKAKVNYQMPKIRSVENTKSKRGRITMIEPMIQNGHIVIAEDWERRYRTFIDEILDYPLAPHDDCPDTLAGCVEITRQDIGRFIRSV